MWVAGAGESIDNVRTVPPMPAPGSHMSIAAVSGAGNVSVARKLERIYVEFAPLVYRTAWGVSAIDSS